MDKELIKAINELTTAIDNLTGSVDSLTISIDNVDSISHEHTGQLLFDKFPIETKD